MRSVLVFMSVLVISMAVYASPAEAHYPADTVVIQRDAPPFVFDDRQIFGTRTTTIVRGNRVIQVDEPTNEVFINTRFDRRVIRPRPQIIIVNGRPVIIR